MLTSPVCWPPPARSTILCELRPTAPCSVSSPPQARAAVKYCVSTATTSTSTPDCSPSHERSSTSPDGCRSIPPRSQLHDYSRQRDRLCPRPTQPSFFVTTAGARPADRRVRAVFANLAEAAGLEPPWGSPRPRIHDLRHSFAVATLLDWYRDGADVASKMPLLSAYLGHVSPASTYWYLQAAPELLALAAQRLEQSAGRLG
jgi:hypothetical protein